MIRSQKLSALLALSLLLSGCGQLTRLVEELGDDDSTAGDDDDSSVGDDDTSTGDDDTSTGDDDTSTGDDDTSTGDDDTSTGDDDTSTGDDDTSTGDDDTSTGDDDTSTGDDDTSTGDDDTSTGDDDTSIGDDDTSTGDDDTSTGDDDTSTGDDDTSTGDDDTSIGDDDSAAGDDDDSAGPGGCWSAATLDCLGPSDSWNNGAAGSTNTLSAWTACTTWTLNGPEYIYDFTPDVSGDYTVTMSGLTYDLDLLLVSGGSAGVCDPSNCTDASTTGGTGDETITFTAVAGDTYFIVAEGWASTPSDFTMTITPDAVVDADQDGLGDTCDICSGDNSTGDTDSDGICDNFDIDQCTDTDTDGVCDDADICTGDDATGDQDTDGICDDQDICTGDDATGDADTDEVCDDLDICTGDDATGDTDADGVCDELDICIGPDSAGDADEDGICDVVAVCASGATLDCLNPSDSWNNGGAGSTNTLTSWSACTTFTENGPEYIYDFTPDASGDYTVTMSGLSSDLDLLLISPGAAAVCDPIYCTDVSAVGGTADETITFTAVAGDIYFIVAEGYSTTPSDFTMTITPAVALDSDQDGYGDTCDICDGDPNSGDTDSDGICDNIDIDQCPNADGDSVCDDLDICTGEDSTGDSDGDGVCDDLDICTGPDSAGDADGDDICDVCTYTLDMADSFGDGWNGGFLEAFEDSTSLGTFSVPGSAYAAIETFDIADGALLELYYTAGSWETENTYDLISPDGATILFSEIGPTPATGLVYDETVACP